MKFFNLLKKELSELINKQMIIGLVVTCSLFLVVGQVMQQVVDDVINNQYSINICDLDDTSYTNEIIDELKDIGSTVNIIENEKYSDDYAKLMNENELEKLIIIPKGFTEDILQNNNMSALQSISIMKSSSSMGTISSSTNAEMELIQSIIKNKIMLAGGLTNEEIALLQTPFEVNEHTVVLDKSAEISISAIMSKLSLQSLIIPIIVFILIIYTSQMLVSAVSTEKIDKTLETLLSAPVSRTAIINAKMLAAAIVALINAVVYMLAFSGMMSGSILNSSVPESDQVSELLSSTMNNESAMAQLGLTLEFTDYILIGIQMFLTIMICLSISLILGAMANDAKAAQTVVMPIMMFAMIPYMISIIADVNTLSPVIRTIIYAIPFTHTFSAISNLMFGNMQLFVIGIIYQAIFFIVCMIFAVRLFNSDKIFTISLNFSKKNKKNSNIE